MGKYHEDATHQSVSEDGQSKSQIVQSHWLSK